MKLTIKFTYLTTLLILLSVLNFPSAFAAECGGLFKRACCLSEQTAERPACDAGLVQVAAGEFSCPDVGNAATCMPIIMPVTNNPNCGGEGERSCCIGEGKPVCDEGLIYHTDASADLFGAVSGDASCHNITIRTSDVQRAEGICISPAANGDTPNPANIEEPETGWESFTGGHGLMNGYHDMHLHIFADLAHGSNVSAGKPAPVDSSGNYVLKLR